MGKIFSSKYLTITRTSSGVQVLYLTKRWLVLLFTWIGFIIGLLSGLIFGSIIHTALRNILGG